MPELEKKKTGGLTALGVLSVVLGGIFFITSVWSLLQPQVHMALVAKHKAPQLLTGLGLAGAIWWCERAIPVALAICGCVSWPDRPGVHPKSRPNRGGHKTGSFR